MELGAGVGALILYTPADLDGEEIEISRDGEPAVSAPTPGSGRGTCPAQTRYAAVYPGLPAGRYTIWRDAHTPAATVTIDRRAGHAAATGPAEPGPSGGGGYRWPVRDK